VQNHQATTPPKGEDEGAKPRSTAPHGTAPQGTVAPIHLGTSSWQHEGWKGVFYPEGMPPKGWLAYYTSQFDTVEINTSFYALPRARTLIDWADAAPPGFTYSLKAPRQITHDRRLQNAQDETLHFLDAVRALGPAAAPALLQFPPEFTRRAFGRILADYLDWLAPRLAGVRVAVEARAADLMTPAFAAFLGERGLALAMVERTHNPPTDLYALANSALERSPAPAFACIRWIGNDRENRGEDREIVTPRPDEIDLWAGRIATLARRGIEVFGYMHNPWEGHSPASVRSLRARLLAEHLPLFSPRDTGQMALF